LLSHAASAATKPTDANFVRVIKRKVQSIKVVTTFLIERFFFKHVSFFSLAPFSIAEVSDPWTVFPGGLQAVDETS